MRLLALGLAVALAAPPTAAETLVAARTIRARAIIAPADLAVVAGQVAGALARPEEAIGLEAKVILYAGRPIRMDDIGPAALVERNAVVQVVFQAGGLVITTEGRALGRAGPGESVRVLNIASRNTVTGVVAPDGRVFVGLTPGS